MKIAGLDIGTTGCKCTVFDETGCELDKAYCNYPIKRKTGSHEIDAKSLLESVNLSYGKMSYVDTGEGEAILSVHGIFGGYDQAYDTCKDLSLDYRIIAPSRFGYLDSDIFGYGCFFLSFFRSYSC